MTPDFTWVEAFLAQEAATAPRLAGYYNHNYVVTHQGQPSVVRVPILGGAVMDVRRLPEAAVLRLLEAHAFPAPRLLYAAADGHIAVHSFIAGRVVNDVYADRARLPDWVAPQLATQLARLHTIPPGDLTSACADLAPSPETPQFLIERREQSIYGRRALIRKQTGELIGDVGVVRAELAGEERDDLGYIVHRAHWGQGYATEAARALASHYLGIKGVPALYANMAHDHVASQRVAERLGMRRTLTFANPRNRGILTYLYILPREGWTLPGTPAARQATGA